MADDAYDDDDDDDDDVLCCSALLLYTASVTIAHAMEIKHSIWVKKYDCGTDKNSGQQTHRCMTWLRMSCTESTDGFIIFS